MFARVDLLDVNEPLRVGHQTRVLRPVREEDQVWQDLAQVSGLQGGVAPRVPGALPSAVHPQSRGHAGQSGRGGRARSPRSETRFGAQRSDDGLSCLCVQSVLADYVTSTPPMIPALVVHCISEIENRGLNAVRAPPAHADAHAGSGGGSSPRLLVSCRKA